MLLVYNKTPGIEKPVERVSVRRGVIPPYMKNLLEKKRVKNKRNKSLHGLYTSMGLFFSLLIVIFIFNYKTYEQKQIELLVINESTDELLDIPVTEQPPPPPPKNTVQQPAIVEVPNEEEIIEEINVDFDIDITEDQRIADVDYSALATPEEEESDEIFLIVEQAPEPAMGMEGFLQFIYDNIHYPSRALRLGVEGKVFVQFVVNSDGTLTDFEVVRGIGAGCDEEALRVLKMAEPWNPGKQRGKPVRVRMILPIHFVFNESL